MTKEALINQLERMAEKDGSKSALAVRLGVTLTYLSDVIHNRREPGPMILKAMGVRRVISYQPIP